MWLNTFSQTVEFSSYFIHRVAGFQWNSGCDKVNTTLNILTLKQERKLFRSNSEKLYSSIASQGLYQPLLHSAVETSVASDCRGLWPLTCAACPRGERFICPWSTWASGCSYCWANRAVCLPAGGSDTDGVFLGLQADCTYFPQLLHLIWNLETLQKQHRLCFSSDKKKILSSMLQ